MEKELKWAVLGTGVIANEMAQALSKMGKHLYAVGNRTHEKAVRFAEKYDVPKVYDDFHEMFTDQQVDVIYITTPHNTHIEFVREALKNKKHVLCEKSITLNSLELDEAFELAEKNGVIFAEAMTIWHMPLYKKLWKLIKAGETGNYDMATAKQREVVKEWITTGIPALGKVQMIQLNFGSYKEYDMKNRFFNMELAGGALLDIGVYALSIARSFMESQPDQILSQVKYAPSGVDEQAGILLMNKEGQMATLALSLHSKQPKRAVISCEKGYIEIMEYPRADKAIIVEAESGKTHTIEIGDTKNALYYELKDMEQAVKENNPSIMRVQDTADVMSLMTQIRQDWGMKYPEEESTK